MTRNRQRAGQRVVCVCCGQEGARASRGLRYTCYERNRLNRTLDTYPASVPWAKPLGFSAVSEDRLTIWHRMMRVPGHTRADVAAVLGIKVDTLERLLVRARKLGDHRAIHASSYRTQVGWTTARLGRTTSRLRRAQGRRTAAQEV